MVLDFTDYNWHTQLSLKTHKISPRIEEINSCMDFGKMGPVVWVVLPAPDIEVCTIVSNSTWTSNDDHLSIS